MRIFQVTKEDWQKVSADAHLLAFSKTKSADGERIDFALVADLDDRMLGYVTCREMDSETLYWQFGGAFPGTIKTSVSYVAYQNFIKWCEERYKRIVTLVENENVVMLKMAMFAGFRITGTRFYRGNILVELTNEFKKEK